jgi:Arc/MetJ-type ribon-helix-helix transcriptional regulator
MMQKRLIFRLPDEMFVQVNRAVENGKAKTPSDLIRQALKEFLKE